MLAYPKGDAKALVVGRHHEAGCQCINVLRMTSQPSDIRDVKILSAGNRVNAFS